MSNLRLKETVMERGEGEGVSLYQTIAQCSNKMLDTCSMFPQASFMEP